MALESLRYVNGQFEVLDQLLLPHESKYVAVTNCKDGWNVIKNMQVRGAPLIAVVAALSLATELQAMTFTSASELFDHVSKQLGYLISARPTAVNVSDLRDRMISKLQAEMESGNGNVEALKVSVIKEAEVYRLEDVNTNKTMGRIGAEHILQRCGDQPVRILTHCNTGALATAGYGTALGVVRCLHERHLLEQCYCTETRPYNQGSRLTAYELVHDGIPATLICDSMASALMQQRQISAVFLGADHVAANGDTANKIGTYQLAIVAKYHAVPFYVVAPSTSIDLKMKSGSEIVIEERPHSEMTTIKGVSLAPSGIKCWNPAFDVTPAELITGGIVTEFGVFTPAELEHKLTAALKGSRS